MKMPFLILVLLLTPLSGLKAQTKTEPLPSLMHSFYSTLFELKPYIVSQEKFADKKNKAKVGQLLGQLAEKVSNSSAPEITESTGFNFTYNLLAQHIRETKQLHEREIYSVAYNNLKSTLSFCISCHDRLPKMTQYKSGMITDVINKNATLEEGEFYYIAHQFENALFVFDNKIRSFKTDDDTDLLNRALVRKLAFYTRVAREPGEAIKSFTEDLKNTNLPQNTQNILKSWIKELSVWNDELKLKTDIKKNESEFIKKATAIVQANTSGLQVNLAYPALIKLLRISGELYERAYKLKGSDEKAEILYLLAKCERDLVSIRGYSLSDIYLKDCVVSYPKSKTAKKCFLDYELSMKQKFNSGDTEYLNKSIEVLRRILEK